MTTTSTATKRKIHLTIGRKIGLSFTLLVVIFIVNVVLIIATLETSNQSLNQSAKILNPSRRALSEFQQLVLNSKAYSVSWVYLPSNEEDRAALRLIHAQEYPALKATLQELMKSWPDQRLTSSMQQAFLQYDSLLLAQKEVMNLLASFEDHQDPLQKFSAESLLDQVIMPLSTDIAANIQIVENTKVEEATVAEQSLVSSFITMRWVVLISSLLAIGLAAFASWYISIAIARPIRQLRRYVLQLADGNLPEVTYKQKGYTDEVSEMEEAFDKLVSRTRLTSEFAAHIGQGKYAFEFHALGRNDLLGNALLGMRDSLARARQDDEVRNWTATGLTEAADLIRQHSQDIQKLSDEFLTWLSKYLKANMSALFVLEDDQDGKPLLEMKAAFAYDRKKFMNRQVRPGKGLVGHCFLEKESTMLTEIPEDFAQISSGLGFAPPNCVMLVPMLSNNQALGVIEIASLKTFEKHELRFIERVGEMLASQLLTLRVSEQTRILLQHSTEQAYELRQQEEELRQNLEELQATQEAVLRSQADLKEITNRLQLINKSTNDGLWDLVLNQDEEDPEVWYSEQFRKMLGYTEADFPARLSAWLSLIHPEDADQANIDFSSYLNGSTHQDLLQFKYRLRHKSGEWRWVNVRGMLHRTNGRPDRIAGAITDIHDDFLQQQEIRRIHAELDTRMKVLDEFALITETDPFGTITFANQRFLAVSGYSMEEIIGKPHNIIRHPDNPKELFAALWRTIKAGRIFKGRYPNRAKDGTDYWVNAIVAPVLDQHGKPVKYISIRTDITDKVREAPEKFRPEIIEALAEGSAAPSVETT